jgi:hypothetical protein
MAKCRLKCPLPRECFFHRCMASVEQGSRITQTTGIQNPCFWTRNMKFGQDDDWDRQSFNRTLLEAELDLQADQRRCFEQVASSKWHVAHQALSRAMKITF